MTASSQDSVYGTAVDLGKERLVSRSNSCSTVGEISLDSLTGSLCNLLSSRNVSKAEPSSSNSSTLQSTNTTTDKPTNNRQNGNGKMRVLFYKNFECLPVI